MLVFNAAVPRPEDATDCGAQSSELDRNLAIVDDEALEWGQWDIFVVPPDATHHHEPDDEAILLGMTDRPVYAEAEPTS